MALEKFLKASDPNLEAVFNEKPYDPTKDRNAFAKSLDKVLEQHGKGQTKAPNRMWSASPKAIRFEAKFRGAVLELGGKKVHYFDPATFADNIKALKEAVLAGELDDALQVPKGTKAASSNSTSTSTRAPDKDPLSGLRKAVGSRISKGQSLDDIANALKAPGSKYDAKDVDAEIASRRKAG